MLAVYSSSSADWVIRDIGVGLNTMWGLVAWALLRLDVEGGSVAAVILSLLFVGLSCLPDGFVVDTEESALSGASDPSQRMATLDALATWVDVL